MVANSANSGQDKIDQRLASLASMSAPAVHDPLRLTERQRSRPGWKPSQRLAAPPPVDSSLRHAGNKSPPYHSKVVIPGGTEATPKTSHVSVDRRGRPANRSPFGDRSRDGLTRRPHSETVPIASDQPLPARPTRTAGDAADHFRNNTAGAARDTGRQGTARGV